MDRPRPLPWIVSLYFAEGLPFSLVHQVSTQVLVSLGAAPTIVGLTSLYGVAWNFKFLMGPVIDGTASLKRWVVALEALLAVAVAALVVPLLVKSMAALFAVFGVVAVLAATHDVAVDGFYIAALDARDQAALSGVRVAPYRAAMLAGNGGLVILAGLTSFRVGFVVAALLLAGVAALHRQALPRPAPEARQIRELPRVLLAWVREPGTLVTLAFLATYRAGDALMFAMNAPFLASLSLGTTARGLVQGVLGTLCSIGGAVLGGLLISRRGLRTTLSPIAILQALAIGLYVLVASFRLPTVAVAAVVAFEQLVSGVGTAGLMVFILERAQGEYKASRFAVLTAIMSLAMTGAGAVSGVIVEATGYPLFFLLALGAAVPGVALSFFVDKGAAEASPRALRSSF